MFVSVLLIREKTLEEISLLEMSQSNNYCNLFYMLKNILCIYIRDLRVPTYLVGPHITNVYVCTYRIFSLISNTYKRL